MGPNQSKPEASNKTKATGEPGCLLPEPRAPIQPINPMPSAQPRLSSAPGILHEQVHELDGGSNVRELDGHADVSRPEPPRRLRHLSELIDPADIPANTHVRSPSGQILTAEEYAAHPTRPKSLRERREEIMKKVRLATEQGADDPDAVTPGSPLAAPGAVSGGVGGEAEGSTMGGAGEATGKLQKGQKGKQGKKAAFAEGVKARWKRWSCV